MELVRLHSRGGFSVRSIVMFCLAVIMTVFLWTTASSTTTLAQPAAATWQNETTILYDGQAYQAAPADLHDSHGITEGSTIYTYTEPQAGSAAAPRGAHFIYFAPGTDPPTATSAEYVRYTFVDGRFSNPQDRATITMTPFGQDGEYSSCEVSGGLGWIICPVTIFLANSMDYLFDLVSNFLAVKPLTLDSTANNSMYNMWNIMRNIANVAFVIAFLILIYAQITSMGVSNYGMKKMVPRLVVAAILVNASFVVSAVAIDISNILGFSVQDIFVAIRESSFYMTDSTSQGDTALNWTVVSAGVLGGGYALFTSPGAIFGLLPILAMLALTLLVVLLVLAARQAIIIILVIIAPLAFVANLLPNTEKWFGKWRDLFMTMLIFFPAFSLIFGGSQLAGQVIIQNAGEDLMMLIFGMAVQVAPLVVTPLILKLSGNLLGRIMQLANNPNKGLVDRTRKYSDSQREKRRQEHLGRNIKKRPKTDPRTWRNRAIKARNYSGRRREDQTAAYKAEADNQYHKTDKYGKIDLQQRNAGLEKDNIHSHHEEAFEKQRQLRTPPNTFSRLRGHESIYDRSLKAEQAKDRLAREQANTAGHYDTLRTVEGSPLNVSRNQAEAAKGNAEAAAQNLTAYHAERRTFQSTEMGKAAINLETAKLNAEGQQSKFTAHIDSLKLKEGTTLQTAAKFAQESKEHAEAAQNRVQTMFERDRKTEGTKLNVSNIALEDSKMVLDEAKNETAVYINKAKSNLEGVLHVQNARTEAAKLRMQHSEAHLKSVVEEYKAGHVPEAADPNLTKIIGEFAKTQQDIGLEAQRTANASKVINDNFADAMISSEERRIYAGGIHEKGANAALANAINTVRSSYNQSVAEAGQIIKHMQLTSEVRQRIALLKEGEAFTHTTEDGKMSYTFTSDDDYAREAAIEEQLKVGTVPDIEKIIAESGEDGDLYKYRSTIASAVASNGVGKRSKNLGGKTIDDILAGTILRGEDGIIDTAVGSIKKGKFSAKELANMDAEGVDRIAQVAHMIVGGTLPAAVRKRIKDEDYDALRQNANELAELAADTLVSDERVNITTASKAKIKKLAELYDPNFVEPELPNLKKAQDESDGESA